MTELTWWQEISGTVFCLAFIYFGALVLQGLHNRRDYRRKQLKNGRITSGYSNIPAI